MEEGTDLGIKISQSGKFFAHVSEKINKCNAIIGQVRRNLRVRTKNSLKLIWNTLILPILGYASMAWYQNLPGINRDLNGVYSRFWKLSNERIPHEVLSRVEYIEWQSLKVLNKISNGNYPIDRDIF